MIFELIFKFTYISWGNKTKKFKMIIFGFGFALVRNSLASQLPAPPQVTGLGTEV